MWWSHCLYTLVVHNFYFSLILRSLCEVTFELHNASQSSIINIVAGHKICPMCRNKLSVREQSETNRLNSNLSDKIDYIEETHSTEQDRQDISKCFSICWYITTGFKLTFQSSTTKNTYKISLVLVLPECTPWLGLSDRKCWNFACYML